MRMKKESPQKDPPLSDIMKLALIMTNPRHDADVELIGPDPVFDTKEQDEKAHDEH